MLNVECSISDKSENSTLLIHHSTLRSSPLRCYPTMQIFSGAMAAAIRRTGTQAEHATLRWREGPQASDHLLLY
jgi:hypothetical protein